MNAVPALRGLARLGAMFLLVFGGIVCLRLLGPQAQGPTATAGASLRVVRLASVEWPPYTSATLPGNGATATVLRKALEASGMELRIEFMPWARVLETVRKDASFVGFFPEYLSADRLAEFVYSAPIGASELCFMERTGHPVPWETLEDLAGLSIGVVQGYVNAVRFDALVAAGQLRTEAVADDLTNIRKVLSGRLPLAVIDPLVLRHHLHTDPSLAPQAGKVRAQERILEHKTLHVCFRKGPEGETLRQAVDAALAGMDALAEQRAAVTLLLQSPPRQ
ncbi:substrate-binding periplasmic protein [Megalodesulfovibrio paquesii]